MLMCALCASAWLSFVPIWHCLELMMMCKQFDDVQKCCGCVHRKGAQCSAALFNTAAMHVGVLTHSCAANGSAAGSTQHAYDLMALHSSLATVSLDCFLALNSAGVGLFVGVHRFVCRRRNRLIVGQVC
jgi:hypothetical protein